MANLIPTFFKKVSDSTCSLGKTLLSLVKIKALKIFMKLAIILGVLWYFSDTWFGKRVATPITKATTGQAYYLTETVINYTQLAAEVSLALVLILVMLGKPIWRWLYLVIGFGLITILLQRFVF